MQSKKKIKKKLDVFDICVIFMFSLMLIGVGYGFYMSNQDGFVSVFPFSDKLLYIDDGNILYGKQKINDHEYYFDKESGIMVTGFYGEKYYDDQGRMATGFKKIGGKTYYFEEDGTIVKDDYRGFTLDGKLQYNYFDKQGVLQINKNNSNENGEVIPNYESLKVGVEEITSNYTGDISVYFKDIRTDSSFLINDQAMYPCCMIKVPALAAIYREIELGNLNYEQNAETIETMITISSNTSYNNLMTMIGNGSGVQGLYMVNQLCYEYGLYNTGLHHGLEPGENFFTDGGANVSTAQDIGILMEKLYKGEVISNDSSQKMIELLKRCEDHGALQRGLPDDAVFAHKTGCAETYYHDGGIVYMPGRDYIIVVFSNGVYNYPSLMEEVSSYIYEYQLYLE